MLKNDVKCIIRYNTLSIISELHHSPNEQISNSVYDRSTIAECPALLHFTYNLYDNV
jgi:hypothetical protein